MQFRIVQRDLWKFIWATEKKIIKKIIVTFILLAILILYLKTLSQFWDKISTLRYKLATARKKFRIVSSSIKHLVSCLLVGLLSVSAVLKFRGQSTSPSLCSHTLSLFLTHSFRCGNEAVIVVVICADYGCGNSAFSRLPPFATAEN